MGLTTVCKCNVFSCECRCVVLTVFYCNTFTILDSSISLSICSSNAGEVFQILGQFNMKLSIVADDANIVFRQVILVGPADDIHPLIQLLGNNSAIVTFKIQAVIKGSYWMIFASGIFIDNTGNAVLAVNTGFASGTSDSQAIGSIFTIQANRPILAVDDDRRAVFPVDADFTIFAVSTFFANAEVICQFQVICFLPFIVGYINLQIFADIGCTFRSCTAFDSDFRMLRSKRLYFIQVPFLPAATL